LHGKPERGMNDAFPFYV